MGGNPHTLHEHASQLPIGQVKDGQESDMQSHQDECSIVSVASRGQPTSNQGNHEFDDRGHEGQGLRHCGVGRDESFHGMVASGKGIEQGIMNGTQFGRQPLTLMQLGETKQVGCAMQDGSHIHEHDLRREGETGQTLDGRTGRIRKDVVVVVIGGSHLRSLGVWWWLMLLSSLNPPGMDTPHLGEG